MGILKDIANDLFEGTDHEGNRTFRTHKAWRRAVKKHKPDAEFYGDKDIGGANGVGEWDGATGVIWKDAGKKAPVKEAHPTDEENDKKEDIVHGLKKKFREFRDRYGKDAKNVMYATATKLAKEDTSSTNDKSLNELHRSTLSNYIKKAVDDVSYHSFAAGDSSARREEGKKRGKEPNKKDDAEQLAHDKKSFKRQEGIKRAAEKMAKPKSQNGEKNSLLRRQAD